MKKICFTLTLLCKIFSQNFISTPTLSPNADSVVFSYGGDIWRSSITGKNPVELTSGPGVKYYPKYSPDGNYIAYTVDHDRKKNVHLMNQSGKYIRQLTYTNSHQSTPTGWSPNSKYIFINSSEVSWYASYTLKIDGAEKSPIFQNEKNLSDDMIELQDGSVVFTDSWLGYFYKSYQTLRLGVQGAGISNLIHFNPKTKQAKNLTDDEGNDLNPVSDKHGTIYFISGRNSDVFNLYKLEDDEPVQLTHYTDMSVKQVSVSWDGSKVAYIYKYQLYIYDVKTGVSNHIKLDLPDVKRLDKELEFSIHKNISAVDVSANDSTLAFISKRSLFVYNPHTKQLSEINEHHHYKDIQVLNENELIYTRYVAGEHLDVFHYDLGTNKETQLTETPENEHWVTLNHSKTKLYYFSGKTHLMAYDLKSKQHTVLTDKLNSYYDWSKKIAISPDDKKLLFISYEGAESDIYLYDLDQKQLKNVTHSLAGAYFHLFYNDKIYFVSDFNTHSFMNTETKNIYSIAYDGTELKNESKRKEKHYRCLEVIGNDLYAVVDTDLYNITKNKRIKDGVGTYSFHSSSTRTYMLNKKRLYLFENDTLNELTFSQSLKRPKRVLLEQIFEHIYMDYTELFYKNSAEYQSFRKIKQRYRPYFKRVQTPQDFETVLLDMLGYLKTSHLSFWTLNLKESDPNKKYAYLPEVLFKDNSPIVSDVLRDDYPLRPGDTLMSVDSISVDQKNITKSFMFKKNPKNALLTFKRGKIVDSVRVKLFRYGNIRDKINLKIKTKVQEYIHSKSKEIGYIKADGVLASDFRRFSEEFQRMFHRKSGLIIDVRANGGGSRSHKFIRLIQTLKTPYLNLNMRGNKQTRNYDKNKPIVLLIDKTSMSEAESIAIGLKELGLALLIGKRTHGYIVYTPFRTRDHYFYGVPGVMAERFDGVDMEGNGVEPDIEVETTYEDREKGRDPQLDAAIDYILDQLED